MLSVVLFVSISVLFSFSSRRFHVGLSIGWTLFPNNKTNKQKYQFFIDSADCNMHIQTPQIKRISCWIVGQVKWK